MWETFVSCSYFSGPDCGSRLQLSPHGSFRRPDCLGARERPATPGPAPRRVPERLRAPPLSRRRGSRRHSPTFHRPQRCLLPRIPAPTKESLRPRAAAGGGGAARSLRAHIPPPPAPVSGEQRPSDCVARGATPARRRPRPTPRGPGAGSGFGRTMQPRSRSGGGKPRRR